MRAKRWLSCLLVFLMRNNDVCMQAWSLSNWDVEGAGKPSRLFGLDVCIIAKGRKELWSDGIWIDRIRRGDGWRKFLGHDREIDGVRLSRRSHDRFKMDRENDIKGYHGT